CSSAFGQAPNVEPTLVLHHGGQELQQYEPIYASLLVSNRGDQAIYSSIPSTMIVETRVEGKWVSPFRLPGAPNMYPTEPMYRGRLEQIPANGESSHPMEFCELAVV